MFQNSITPSNLKRDFLHWDVSEELLLVFFFLHFRVLVLLVFSCVLLVRCFPMKGSGSYTLPVWLEKVEGIEHYCRVVKCCRFSFVCLLSLPVSVGPGVGMCVFVTKEGVFRSWNQVWYIDTHNLILDERLASACDSISSRGRGVYNVMGG